MRDEILRDNQTPWRISRKYPHVERERLQRRAFNHWREAVITMTAKEFYKLNSRRRRLDDLTVWTLMKMLLVEHGLRGWKGKIGVNETGDFDLPEGCRAGGWCDYKRRLIIVALSSVKLLTPAQIRDIILHEIAHALVGPGRHGVSWAEKAEEIGVRVSHLGVQLVVEPECTRETRCYIFSLIGRYPHLLDQVLKEFGMALTTDPVKRIELLRHIRERSDPPSKRNRCFSIP